MKKYKLIGALLGLAFVVMGVFAGDSAYAADAATMMKKWTFINFRNCASGNSTYINSPIDITKESGNVADSIFNKSNEHSMLPSYGFYGAPNTKITCKDVFVGNNKVQGVLDYYNPGLKNVNYSLPDEAADLLDEVGYGGAPGNNNETDEASFSIRVPYNTHVISSNPFCWLSKTCEYDIPGETETVRIVVTPNDKGGKTYKFVGVGERITNFLAKDIKLGFTEHKMTISLEGNLACTAPAGQSHSFDLKENVEEFYNDIRNYFVNTTWSIYCNTGNETMTTNYTFEVNNMVSATTRNVFHYDRNRRNEVIEKLSGGMSSDDLMYTDGELYTLYFYYLQKALPNNVQNRMTCDPENTDHLEPVKLKDVDGVYKECFVNFNPNGGGTDPRSIPVNVPVYNEYGDTPGPVIRASNLRVAIDWLNSKDDIEDEDVPTIADDASNWGTNGGGTNGGGSAGVGAKDLCYDAGVKAMGWLLCPALSNMQSTATVLDDLIEGWLEVGTEWYDSSSGTYTAWGYVRSISNTLMIIVLVVIILSQLTGYGIDNYGIKKMLPRLIVMAILLNLSFIICELAVDVANILGVGLRDMFKGLGGAVAANGNGWAGAESFIGGAITAIFAAGGVSGAVAPTVITISTVAAGGGIMSVIVILLALLTILAALVVFFLMLAARSIIIIGCIAVSPLAFASFVLPNTQGLFKKWLGAFRAALVMFPICGAVGGLGVLIRAMVSTTQGVNLLMIVVGFIAPFLPFFMLPTLLRGALATLGKVGGALTAVGSAWRGGIKGAEGAVRSTDSYKTTMQEGHLRRMRNSLGIGEDGKLTAKGIKKEQRARAKGGAAMRRYAARAAMVQKDDLDKQKAMGSLLNLEAQAEIPSARLGYTDGAGNVTTLPDNDRDKFGGAFGDGTRGAYYGSQFLTAARKGDTVGMGAAIMAAQSSGMKEKDIASMVRQANNQGHINLGGNEKRAWAQDLAAQHGNGFLATDYELKEWAQRGGADTLGDYGHYFGTTNIKSDDIKENDVARLSGNSMAAMILSGKMSKTMAKNVLAQNPGLSEDKKIMLGALANGVTFNATTASDLATAAASAAAQYASASANTKINIGGGQMISQKTISKWLEPQFKVR